MNYLAHLLLSPPDAAFRVGNLLPDLLRLPQLEQFDGRYRDGIALHRRIDAFTDAHPLTRRSRQRLWPTFRRFSGVIVDVVYDHCLIQRWEHYHEQPLPLFLAEVRASLPELREDLPDKAYRRIDSLTQWLGDYETMAGVSTAMTELGRRLRRPVEFVGLQAALERQQQGFLDDFDAFFPDLVAMTETVMNGSAQK
ncbi:ACP phosphodiesterase [Labrys neptuniae]|uniref:acyl carrier protein phosphodiesterase n=1 Tax=Labrys TaxID=204476 RepID=UPI002891CB98|nr:ACP phosphodiesterase [Labrys neptuniae]MDT3381846.1 ACP phosphodiesterase [Labrys neptuniae]